MACYRGCVHQHHMPTFPCYVNKACKRNNLERSVSGGAGAEGSEKKIKSLQIVTSAKNQHPQNACNITQQHFLHC